MVKELKELEHRKYDTDSTPEEIELIKQRVWMHKPQIIYFHEVVVISSFTINTMFDEVHRLGKDLDKHGLLIDLRDSFRPNAETRRTINKRFSKLLKSVVHVSFCSGKNILMNTAAKFVMYQTDLDSYSIHKTMEAAEQEINAKLNE